MKAAHLLMLAAALPWYRSDIRPENAPQLYWSDNPVTSLHESVHWANSQLSNRYGGQCLYVDSGHFVRFAEIPGFHLRQVAPLCRYRGQIFHTYLIKSLQGGGTYNGIPVVGHSSPLYLFDEWAAYTAGSALAVYGGYDAHGSIEFMLEMGYYCSVVVDHLPAGYADADKLRAFFAWQAQRCLRIADDARRTRRNYRRSQDSWREWLRTYVRSMPDD